MKKIGLVLALAGMLLAGSMAWSNPTHAGHPPDCAPEDKVVAGNTNTDCKWDYRMDGITGVRFAALEREGADACYGALEFYPHDGEDLDPRSSGMYLELTHTNKQTGQPEKNSYDIGVRKESGDSTLRMIGVTYDLNSPVPERWWTGYFNTVELPSPRFQHVRVFASGEGSWVRPTLGVNYTSPWFLIPPRVNDFPVMLNACLNNVKLRLETAAQMERDRTKLAAQELAKQRALNEEKAKAALDAQRLASAQKALQIQRETELTKTRSLIARLERDKIILSIWNDIVLARLRGFQERAEITNRYLAEIEANAAAFSGKVREKYAELQRLEALNQAIADSIAAHNAEIEAQLAAAAELEARNMEKLEDLSVTPPTPAPTPGG